MKKDTQHRPGVSKSSASSAKVVPVSGPSADGSPRRLATLGATAASNATDAAPSITISARYIDSRLKQFCWR
jgi:hypothetical protein